MCALEPVSRGRTALVLWCTQRSHGLSERESLTFAVRQQSDGSAASAQRVLLAGLADLNAVGKQTVGDRGTITLASFAGSITDHQSTEKKLNSELEKQIHAEAEADSPEASIAFLHFFCWNHK